MHQLKNLVTYLKDLRVGVQRLSIHQNNYHGSTYKIKTTMQHYSDEIRTVNLSNKWLSKMSVSSSYHH